MHKRSYKDRKIQNGQHAIQVLKHRAITALSLHGKKLKKTCFKEWRLSTKKEFNDSFVFYFYTFSNGNFTTLGDNQYYKSYKFTVRCIKSK